MISIIIATKNGSRTICDAIKSIQDQTEQNFELLIVSDASTDNTEEIVSEMAIKDDRIKLIRLVENVGPGKARRIGIEKSSRNLIALLDDDDLWISKVKLENQKKFLLENCEHVLVGSDTVRFVDEQKNFLFNFESEKTDGEIKKHILMHNPFVTSSVMFRKDIYEKVGGFSNLRLAEEYELWLKMGKMGLFANLKNCEVEYMRRASGLTVSRNQEMNRIVISLIEKHKNDYPHYLFAIIKAHLRVLLTRIKKLTV